MTREQVAAQMEARFIVCRQAHVGETIKCATCANQMLKTFPGMRFCSTKGAGNCKDTYNLTVHPEKEVIYA